jgi:hypothetical protein
MSNLEAFLLRGNANILRRDHLKTQSYAQTAMGFYNIPAGSTSDTTSAKTHGNDPLVIVGNGTSAHRSDAFLVTNGGASQVFQNLGSNDSMISPPLTRLPIYGARTQDNTISAWGSIPATKGGSVPETLLTNSDYGVSNTPPGVVREGTGVYVIQISLNINSASIIVTPIDDSALTRSSGCLSATCSPMGTPHANQFIVRTYSNCSPANEAFYFQLVGR